MGNICEYCRVRYHYTPADVDDTAIDHDSDSDSDMEYTTLTDIGVISESDTDDSDDENIKFHYTNDTD
jgi:hypothetical protein